MYKSLYVFLLLWITSCRSHDHSPLVLLTDFGTRDGAVAAMKGVALKQDKKLIVHDLTHEIPPFNIFEGAYRLQQTAPYWPEGAVFVGVVDPGVGTRRKSVVLKTKAGHYYVGPDNGLFSLVAGLEGIEAVREIRAGHRLEGSGASYTFHGRDVFAYTGARLAAGLLRFEEVGELLPGGDLVQLDFPAATGDARVVSGGIPVLDVQYGNVWSNIDQKTFSLLKIKNGDLIHVRIFKQDSLVTELNLPFVHAFGDVKEGDALSYMNSLMQLSFGINMGSFAERYGVSSGSGWKAEVRPAENSSGK